SVTFVRELLPMFLVGVSLFAGALLFGFFRRRMRPAAAVRQAMGDMLEGAFLQQV
ncbi:MAG: hypothetical protein GWN58_41210, partial [Anaerolineae bacterium]|nr:hypothetical protein [Anaerolineae bacterium]